MANKLKISRTPTGTTGPNGAQRTDQRTGSKQITSSGVTGYPGSVGGIYTQAGPQIHPQVDTGNGATDGSILRQKGAHKFYCTDGTTKRICKLVPSMVPDGGVVNGIGQISIPVYTTVLNNANVTARGSAATSTYLTYEVSLTTGGTSGIKLGANVMGTGISGNVVISAINTTSAGIGNVTVNFSSQVVTGETSQSFYTGFFADRISNRWVWDIQGNKYRYWNQTPTTAATYVTDKVNGVTGFVQVPDAA